MEKIYITNLEDFEKILSNQKINNNTSEEPSIIYVKDKEKKYFILDEDKIFYKKVPELGAPRQLYAMKLLEVINNKYIPIFNSKAELVFSKEEYNSLRKKMQGIKSYQAEDFSFSNNLYFPELDYYLEQIDANFKQVESKRTPVVNEFVKVMESIGLKTTIGNNSGGDIELVEAGSTIRGTNLPNTDGSKWDFDFTVRINPDKVWIVKEALETKLKAKGHITKTSKYKVRLIDVEIPGLDELIDLDFSLTPQKEKYLSTEDTLQEKLENMRKTDYEKYRLVLANIMYAKHFLKENGVYKPSRGILEGDRSNGGLGGVGIENWILQNGGSFIDAAKEFLKHAEGKDFIDFQKEYAIMDFGKNHVSVSKKIFPYDNFIMKNMRHNGYNKMVESLRYFIDRLAKGHKK